MSDAFKPIQHVRQGDGGFTPVENLTIDKFGNPSPFAEETAFAQLGTRLQLSALSRIDPTQRLGGMDFITSSVGELFQSGTNRFQFQNLRRQLAASGAESGSELQEALPKGIVSVLVNKGFDFDEVKNMDADRALQVVSHFLMRTRLQQNIDAGSDSTFESVVGGGLQFGQAVLLDPLNFASIGAAAGLRKALRAVDTASNAKPYIKKTAQAVNKYPNATGLILGSDNVILTSALEVGTVSTAFDLAMQRQEYNIVKQFVDQSAQWQYSYSRGALSAGVGGLLGAGIGTILNRKRPDKNVHQMNKVLDTQNPKGGNPGQRTTQRPGGTSGMFTTVQQKLTPMDVEGGIAARQIVTKRADQLPPDVAVKVRTVLNDASDTEAIYMAKMSMAGATSEQMIVWHAIKNKRLARDQKVLKAKQDMQARQAQMYDRQASWLQMNEPVTKQEVRKQFMLARRRFKAAQSRYEATKKQVYDSIDVFKRTQTEDMTQAQFDALTRRLDQARSRVQQIDPQIVQAQRLVRVAQNRVKRIEMGDAKSSPEYRTFVSQIVTARREIDDTPNVKRKLDQSITKKQAQVKRKKQRYGASSQEYRKSRQQLMALTRQRDQLPAKVKSLQQKMAKAQTKVNNLRKGTARKAVVKQVRTAKRKLNDLKRQRRQLNKSMRQLSKKTKRPRPAGDQFRKNLADLTQSKARVESLKAEKTQLQAKIKKSRRSIANAKKQQTKDASQRALDQAEEAYNTARYSLVVEQRRLRQMQQASISSQSVPPTLAKTRTSRLMRQLQSLYDERQAIGRIIASGVSQRMDEQDALQFAKRRARNAKDFKLFNQKVIALKRQIDNGSVTTQSRNLSDLIDGISRPNRSLPIEGQVAKLDMLTITGDLAYNMHNPTVVSKLLNSQIARFVSNLFIPRASVQAEAAKHPIVGMVAGLLDHIGLTTSGMQAGNARVLTITQAYNRLKRRTNARVYRPMTALKKAYRDKQTLDKKLIESYRVAANLTDTKDPLVKDLSNAIRGHYDQMAARGIQTGVISQAIDDFVSVTLNQTAAHKHRETLKNALVRNYKRRFMNFDFPDTELHRGTLNMIRFIRIENDTKVVTTSIGQDLGMTLDQLFDVSVPKKFSEFVQMVGDTVDPDTGIRWVDLYKQKVQSGLQIDANAAINKKLDGGRSTDRAGDAQDKFVNYTGYSNRTQRMIQQDVFLSEQIMNLGVVDLDPVQNLLNYNYVVGNRIVKQQAVNAFTGQKDITFQGLVAYMQTVLRKDPAFSTDQSQKRLTSLIQSIKSTDLNASGKMSISGQGQTATDMVVQTVLNIASIPVNAGIPVAMLAVEIPAQVIQMLIKDPHLAVRSFIKAIKDSNFSHQQMMASGHMTRFMIHQNRVFGDSGFASQGVSYSYGQYVKAPFKRLSGIAKGTSRPRTIRGTDNRAANFLMGVPEAASDLTRAVSGQLYLTSRARAARLHFQRSLVGKRVNKMVKFNQAMKKHQGKTGAQLVKAIKTQARASGFGSKWGDAQQLMNSGLLQDDILSVLQSMVAAGVDDFGDMTKVNRFVSDAYKFDEQTGDLATETVNRLIDFATDRTDSVIVQPGVWDRPSHSSDPLSRIMNSFLSYARGFRSRRLQDVADRGSLVAASWFSMYALMEVMNQQARMVIFGDTSFEQLMQKWDKEPQVMLRRSLTQVPILGPFQNVVFDTIGKHFGSEQNVRFGQGPAAGITGSILNDVGSIVSGQADMDTYKRVSKSVPGLNTTAFQILWNAMTDNE